MIPVPESVVVLRPMYKEGHSGGKVQSLFDVNDPIEPATTNTMIVIIISALFEFHDTFGFLFLTDVLSLEAMLQLRQIILLSLCWWHQRRPFVSSRQLQCQTPSPRIFFPCLS